MKKNYPTVRGPLLPGIKLDENIYVTMRDGIKVAVDIYRPEAEGQYPGLLSMSPYIKEIQQQPPELSHDIEAGATSFFVPRGYVHIVAQIRGTGFSQGQYNFLSTIEQQDGYDLVEWIAQQPWCDGNVGMLGDSYFAIIQYLVAAQQPPHLKCISPCDGLTDPYRHFVYRGGLFNSWFMGMWGTELVRQCLWPGAVEGKLPPSNLFVDWASHSEDGPYFWERAARTKLDKIKVPMLSIVPQSFTHITGQLYAYPIIEVPKKLLVVPSSGPHANVHFLRNKALNEQLLRWFDHWLKGIDTGIMDEPEVAIYDAITEEWRYENEYPLARTEWTKFYLRSNPEGPATESPYGLINMEPPENEEPDKYMNPQSMGRLFAGKPVLAYATSPLEKDMRVWGPLSAILYGSSTTLDTAWFIKLGDVGPDDNVQLIAEGQLKASFREVDESKSKPGQPFHPFQNPVPPEPNDIYEYQIEMRPIFYTIKAGHKIWVQIASHDLGYQSFLHTIYASEMLPVPAENTIYHDSEHPSYLLLPVIPDAPIIKPVGPPVSQIKWPSQQYVL
jgi:predicted acyl esterase